MTVTALHPANRRDHTPDKDTPWRGSVHPQRQNRHPALTRLVTLEIRKTLSTRSGRLLLGTAAVLPAVGISTVLALGQDIPGAREMLAVVGSLVAILTLVVGILSTAGEWTHRTIQTTLLAVPPRPRRRRQIPRRRTHRRRDHRPHGGSTLTITAIAAGPDFLWTGAALAVAATIATGAALAAVGAGIEGTITNTAAALTGTFVTLLIALPVLAAVRPNIADKIDPLAAMVNIVTDHQAATRHRARRLDRGHHHRRRRHHPPQGHPLTQPRQRWASTPAGDAHPPPQATRTARARRQRRRHASTGAFGLTGLADPSDLELQMGCYRQETTPVCADAARQGPLWPSSLPPPAARPG